MSIGTYGEPDAVSKAIGYAKFYSRSHDAVIRVYDDSGNVIETHEHAGDFNSATINKESTNENNTDVDRWVDARRLRINGKPCS
jgi:hypothetical protein